jgi:hypothetical protein
MLLTTISQCNNCLDFSPLSSKPDTWPAVSIGGYLISGFNRAADAPVLELLAAGGFAPEAFAQAFFNEHPALSLPELARFWTKISSLSAGSPDIWPDIWPETWPETWKQVLLKYSLRDSETLKETLLRVAATPRDFQNWASFRGLSAKDLGVLKSLPSLTDVDFVFSEIVRLDPTRSTGVSLLELMVELHLMGRATTDILKVLSEGAEAGLKKLQSMRNPMAAERDLSAQAAVENWPWPQYAQAKWTRLGDQSAVEVKFHFRSVEDFKRKLEGLERVQNSLQTPGLPTPWKTEAKLHS